MHVIEFGLSPAIRPFNIKNESILTCIPAEINSTGQISIPK